MEKKSLVGHKARLEVYHLKVLYTIIKAKQ